MKTRLLAIAAAGCVVALAACSSGSPSSTPESGSGGERVEGQTISVTLSEGTYTNQLKAMLPEFEEQTGIKVELTTLGLDQMSNQYQVKLNAGSSDLDVIYYRPLQETLLYADNGWLADLTELVESDAEWDWNDFTEASRESIEVDDLVYGVPTMTERQILFYNTEMFEAAGVTEPPATMDELAEVAAELNDPDNGQFGIVMRGQLSAAVTQLSGFLYSFGGDWFDVDRMATIDTPEAVEAYEYYGGLLRDYGPRSADSIDGAQARAIFSNGQAAMYIDADSGAGLLEDPKESQVAGKVGYAKFPEGPAGTHPYDVTSWAAGISEFSTKKDASWEFVKWATSKQVLDDAMTLQKSPSPRISSWEDPEVAEGFSQELVDIFESYIGNAVGYDRPVVVEVSKVRDIVGKPIVTAINGGNVAESADAANQEFQAYLDTER